jgi:hypothetical protein
MWSSYDSCTTAYIRKHNLHYTITTNLATPLAVSPYPIRLPRLTPKISNIAPRQKMTENGKASTMAVVVEHV